MALPQARHSVVCLHMPYLPDQTNMPNHNSPCHRNTCTPLRKNAYGHHASPALRRLCLHHTRAMLAHKLPRVPRTPKRNHANYWQLDLPRHTLPMGHTSQNHLRQWKTLCHSTRLSREEVPHQAYPYQRLQLAHKWNRQAITLQCLTSIIQGSRWRTKPLGTSRALGILGGTCNSTKVHGMLAILRGNWNTPAFAFRYHRG